MKASMLEQSIFPANAEPKAGVWVGPENSSSRWYAAYTCSRHEKHVSRQLRERQIDCFLPVYSSVRRWKDRRKEVEFPLFPGYVFVHIGEAERLRVLQVSSVVHLVSFNGRPAPLQDHEIESLRNGIANGICPEPYPYLKVGRRVRVKYGPLAGIEGFLVRRKDKFRVVISIDLIMRSIAAEVQVADLE
jgi:transcription antitermination factor NusG